MLIALSPAQTVEFTDFLKAEGIVELEVIDDYSRQYDRLINDLKIKLYDIQSIHKQHQIIFNYLYENQLKKYSYIPFLTIIFDINHYNNLTATILYTLITETLDHTYQLYMTENHVFLIISDPESKEIYIDLSSRDDGFDSKDNKKSLIRIILSNKIVTQEDINNTKPEEIIENYFKTALPISLNDLLPLYYTQIALSHYSANRYLEAYKNVASAMGLNPNLSHIKNNFISLWTMYRNMLFQNKDFNTLDSLLISSVFFMKDNEDFEFIYTGFLKTYATFLSNEQSNPVKAITLMAEVTPYIKKEEKEEIDRKLYVQKIEELLNKGDFETAYNSIKELYIAFPESDKIKELFLKSSQNFMGALVNAGSYKKATVYLDSLLLINANDILIKNLYSNVLLAEMSLNRTKYMTDPVAAESLMVVANAMDTTNVSIKQSLVYLYHSRAMQFTRDNDLENARVEIEKGLLIDPLNRELLEDLRLLNEQLSQ